MPELRLGLSLAPPQRTAMQQSSWFFSELDTDFGAFNDVCFTYVFLTAFWPPPSFEVTHAKMRVAGHVAKASIGAGAGAFQTSNKTADFLNPVTFSGSREVVQNVFDRKLSDLIEFPWNGADDVVVRIYSGASNISCSRRSPKPAGMSSGFIAGDEVDNLSLSGEPNFSGNQYWLEEIILFGPTP